MKVAIVLNTSWNIYNFRMGLIESLQGEGIEVHAVAPEDEYSKILTQKGCVYHKVKMDSRGANPVKDTALFFELYKIYKQIDPDVIFHFTVKPNIYGTLAAKLLKIPTVNNVCGLGTVFLKDNLISKIAIYLYKFSFKFPAKIFFQNSDDRQLFIERKLADKSICDVIPGSGINISHFSRNRSFSYSNKTKFQFLLISRLIYDKGVQEFVQAARLLRQKGIEAQFQILGAKDTLHKRGIPEKIINEWVNEGIVSYLGVTKDVRSFISNADCVILPSYREGTPRTLLEAASMQKPIVATNVAGCRNIVEDNFNGFLCNLKDAEDLASKMEAMLNLPEEQRVLMGRNGRKLVEEKFDEKLVINKYIESIYSLNQRLRFKQALAV